MGISGRIAQTFQNNAITPLLALFGLLLGFFAIAVTPKEEEPQIDVTFANVFIAYPGASAKEVESLISTPAEQVLSEIPGVDEIYSVSRSGMSVLTVAFEVGLERETAILNLYNQVYSHADWLPQNLGASQPLIKPMGIDDVPIMSLTLHSDDKTVSQRELTDLAHLLEVELKRIPGTRDIYTQGQHHDVVSVRLDPVRLNAYGITYDDVSNTLRSSNAASPARNIAKNNELIQIQAGNFLSEPREVEELVVGMSQNGSPIYLADVANIELGIDTPDAQVFHFSESQKQSRAAMTIAIAKQPGTNAFDITQAIEKRLAQLKGVSIPDNIHVDVTRNYGDTAKAKSDQLIAKLLFATAAVVLLVLATMSWREAVIVGGAIFITLAITLFASWAWGFTLNRISLFALIFSIGILVDDAIVVVENIHRHLHMGGKKILEAIPLAVDEVGGPTILATFTVIAALMPMAFVSGLMGPYMSPIPINASTGMLISLVIAFVVTPWLSYKLLKNQDFASHSADHDKEDEQSNKIYDIFNRIMRPLIQGEKAEKNRLKMLGFVIGLILLAVTLPVMKLVVLKMLPFDNKSEFQVIVDMPEGTPMEETLAVLEELGTELQNESTVKDYQVYAGVNAPINFNGLVRQYYLRNEPHMGDIQVNLVGKDDRDEQSHDIALRVRPKLQAIGARYDANVKVVEVPPGPPVMAPIVAEVYGANYEQQLQTAKQLRSVFESTVDIIDVDDSIEAAQAKTLIRIDRQKAAQQAVPYGSIVEVLDAALAGHDVSYLHSEQKKYATPIRIEFEEADKADWQALLQTPVRNMKGELIPISELVYLEQSSIDQTIYHKNLLPVVFVNADMAGELDSPLYGLFDMSFQLDDNGEQDEFSPKQYFISQPEVSHEPSIKWDGEWQITYETFRDMGIAYGVGMILIYLLVVAQFKSYLVPLIIMAPIPLTIIGVMPGHALLGAQFTATSMIGMIALAGIIVRNSILLVDFINQELDKGTDLVEAAIQSAAVRTKPILLTGIAAMTGAFFILTDPIFNGLAISLIFGILISTIFTLVLIPMLYYVYLRKRV
ncbi:efflux RND transporter permease subunit [Bermanella marisrubri]|uniref:AcrB/AcrD/AcrF family protein n=1 Tax=Bermanella marisrubri TaxID=207949 RepID=Q1N1T7_9GAMM|nr:efflux RND transporter permease subunit [Bermanella marisrubri]EAT12194.1 AcrB/AcrD/AcrF family protein [Oceanobacter sp. RED65] [Bermanella marisrubri]